MIERNIPCPHCTSVLRVPNKYAGRQVSCKHCGTVFEVPPVENPQLAPSSNGVKSTAGPRADEAARPASAATDDLLVQCPKCSGFLKMRREDLGRSVPCPHCANSFEPAAGDELVKIGDGPGVTASVARLGQENDALREELKSLGRALRHERARREDAARQHDVQVTALREDWDHERAAWEQEREGLTASLHDAERRHAAAVAELERGFREALHGIDRPAQESPDAVISRVRLEADLAEKSAQLEGIKATLLEAQNFQTRMKMVLSGLGIGLPN